MPVDYQSNICLIHSECVSCSNHIGAVLSMEGRDWNIDRILGGVEHLP